MNKFKAKGPTDIYWLLCPRCRWKHWARIYGILTLECSAKGAGAGLGFIAAAFIARILFHAN